MLLLGSASVAPVDISINLNFETDVFVHVSEDVVCVTSLQLGSRVC